MKEKTRNRLRLIGSFLSLHKRWILTVTSLCLVFVAGIVVTLAVASGKEEVKEIEIEPTPIEIENIRPRGEIVVCSSVLEDYASMKKTDTAMGLFKTEHVCAQLLTQKCCYKIDLDKVEYSKEDSTNIVWVKLPEPEYNAYTQNSDFISDDEEFWIEALPSTNNLKRKVSKQIEQRFCTPTNKRKAERYAEDVVSKVMKNLGYEVEFVRTIETRKD